MGIEYIHGIDVELDLAAYDVWLPQVNHQTSVSVGQSVSKEAEDGNIVWLFESANFWELNVKSVLVVYIEPSASFAWLSV